MASVTGICNMALARLGHGKRIGNITEVSAEAKACELFYEQSRDFALREFNWPFAKRRAALVKLAAAVDEAETFPRNWGFKYALPSNCLFAREIFSGLYQPREDQKIQFEILYDGSVDALYTDLDEAELFYTAKITDTTRFDPLFTSALVYLLATELGSALSTNEKLAGQMREAYYQIVSIAQARAAQERQENPPTCEFLEVR